MVAGVRVPCLLKFDLYAPDQTRYPVVEQSPDQTETETKDPVEDGQEDYGPDVEQQPGERIERLGVGRTPSRAQQGDHGDERPDYEHQQSIQDAYGLTSESSPTLLIIMRDLPDSYDSHTTRSRDQASSHSFKGAGTGR